MRDLFAVVSRLSSFMLSLVVVSQVIATAAAAGWLAVVSLLWYIVGKYYRKKYE